MWTTLPAMPAWSPSCVTHCTDTDLPPAHEAPATQVWPLLQPATELQSLVHAQWKPPGHSLGRERRVEESEYWLHYWSNTDIGRLRDVPKARKKLWQKVKKDTSLDRKAIFCSQGHTRIGKRKIRTLDFTGSFILGGGGGRNEESGHQCASASGESFSSSCCYRSWGSYFSAVAKHCCSARQRLEQGFPQPSSSFCTGFSRLCTPGFWDRSGTGLCLGGKTSLLTSGHKT